MFLRLRHRLVSGSIKNVQNLLYGLYSKVLERNLSREDMPKHIGVMVDGNRRWAKVQGFEAAGQGHAAGAKKIIEFLLWCSDLGVKHVTLYLLSTDNLKGRTSQELTELLDIIVSMSEELADIGLWKLQMVGDKEALPASAIGRLEAVEKATNSNSGTHVNLAIAYGGRKEIADAMRDILRKHFYTGGQPDPDLLIRTSGEQRLSGFLLWQSANSEFYFAEALWPDFRRVDFLRALRDFQGRHRRYGS
jgi:short-chain Z-isoprenyl diphosphate synthase